MAGILAEKPVNTGRQFEVDMARLMALFTMVLVHIFEKLELADVLGQPAGTVIEFAGGPLSAPVFMTAMGLGIAYSKQQQAAVFAARGKQLIRQGYWLNLLRGGLVFMVVYTLSGDDAWLKTTAQAMLVLDILHFAGMAFLLFALLKRLRAKAWQMLALAVVMEAVATVAKPVVADSLLLSGIVGYLFFQSDATCFPLFSWFIYPVAGYCFALLLQRVASKTRFYARVLVSCAAALALYTGLLLAAGYDVMDIFLGVEYYAQGLVRASWILLVCGMVYSLLYFASLGVGTGRLRALIEFASSRVNDIYIYHWVLVMWPGVFIFLHMQMTPLGYYALVVATLAASILLVYAKEQLVRRLKKPQG